MNIDEQRLQQFFTELKAKREAFDENYKYFAPQLAPQFNCFDFIDSDENKLLEIIAHSEEEAQKSQNTLLKQRNNLKGK
jgi:spore cortex formation protein SpoVR/YcgB (stage V sporulation)